MSVPLGEQVPVPWKILVLRHLHFDSRIGEVAGFRFAPDTDIRVQALDIGDEMVIVVGLVGPHPVLDVPIEHLQLFSLPVRRTGQGKEGKGEEKVKDPFHTAAQLRGDIGEAGDLGFIGLGPVADVIPEVLRGDRRHLRRLGTLVVTVFPAHHKVLDVLEFVDVGADDAGESPLNSATIPPVVVLASVVVKSPLLVQSTTPE